MIKTIYEFVTGEDIEKSVYKEKASYLEIEMDNARNEFAKKQYSLLSRVEALINEMEKSIVKSSADDKYIKDVKQRKNYLEKRLKECQLL